jgi:hypothetical protein
MLQPSLEHPIPHRVQVLLDVTEGTEGGPDLAHRRGVDGSECSDRRGIEVHSAGAAASGACEFLVTEEDGAGDDAGFELEKDDRAGRGAQTHARIPESSAAARQITQEQPLLHIRDAALAETLELVAHRKDPHRGNVASHAVC